MKYAQSTTLPDASMASATSTTNPPVTTSASWGRKILAKLIYWQNLADQRRHLREIDDRLLADIGISRIDALKESSKPFWQD